MISVVLVVGYLVAALYSLSKNHNIRLTLILGINYTVTLLAVLLIDYIEDGLGYSVTDPIWFLLYGAKDIFVIGLIKYYYERSVLYSASLLLVSAAYNFVTAVEYYLNFGAFYGFYNPVVHTIDFLLLFGVFRGIYARGGKPANRVADRMCNRIIINRNIPY